MTVLLLGILIGAPLGYLARPWPRMRPPHTARDLHVMLFEDEHDRIARRWRQGGAI